jgi:hypothetical protein
MKEKRKLLCIIIAVSGTMVIINLVSLPLPIKHVGEIRKSPYKVRKIVEQLQNVNKAHYSFF